MTETLRTRTTRNDIFSPDIFRSLQPRMEPRLSVGRVGKRVQSLASKSFCTAALTMILLFAAVLLGVTPAEASLSKGDAAEDGPPSVALHALAPSTSAIAPSRFGFAEGVSLLDVEGAPGCFGLFGLEMSRCERTYAIEQADGGEHTFTYSHQGANGEVFGYDSTSARNTPREHDSMEKTYPDWTGDAHRLVDVTTTTINNRPNPNSPVHGAAVLGVVTKEGRVDEKGLADAASKVKMNWGGKAGRQCFDFSIALAAAARYQLILGLHLFGQDIKDFRSAAEKSAPQRIAGSKDEEKK